MVKITITPDRLFLEVQDSHKFWALKSSLSVPLDHIRGVHADPKPAMGWFQGFKLAGADIPHIFRAGMFYQDGDKVFWDVRHPKKTIVIELEDETCAKLIVEVKNPEAAVKEILKAIEDYRISKDRATEELDRYVGGLSIPTKGQPVTEDSKERLRQKR